MVNHKMPFYNLFYSVLPAKIVVSYPGGTKLVLLLNAEKSLQKANNRFCCTLWFHRGIRQQDRPFG